MLHKPGDVLSAGLCYPCAMKNSLCHLNPRSAALTGLLLIITAAIGSGVATANDPATDQHHQARGLLDQPVETATTDELKDEREFLLELSDNALSAKANSGDRSAQMILAERFALESESLAFAPVAANAAMSDAAYWSALAAQRGYPGAAPSDVAFPSFPLRAHRR